ncbi:Zn-dependent hydrolase [Flagellimonas halotolerans]|uniref:Zn-dependent hydrolase n=1 Tax=Flagellimonas halotolerans TaxID=3112164 RepID=A0ABU6IU55_9FLAO|nr:MULTISPECIES: Zn-dependent hydrolase [unclassified Allomuricauda]MEC3966692.1 Zn-dependent hydrolase [Muricauda sp. SYSU M86414]MEC4266502.1 Zn-dependent hydrolase [Muricauda sp. SYSU M84420]
MKVLLTNILALFVIGVLSAQQPKVNQHRLEKRIFNLAEFGLQENGETERVAFSDADIDARNWVIKTLKGFGMGVKVDAAGNIIGTRQGTDSSKKPIAFGSHIDRVPNGGNYDGCLGSMAALEVIETLNENNIETNHPLEVIIFPNEEGGVMGSRAMAGNLGKSALSVVNSTGYSMGDGIMRIGGDTTKLEEAKRKKGSLAAFLELHIEQGGKLEKEKLDIGIVEGIVGLNWWDVVFTGFANHAGTTPMDARQDALLAAAKYIVAVNEVTNSFEGSQVGTVGRIKAEPGAPNVIPGKVIASLEIRDLSSEVIQKVYEAIKEKTEKIAKASNVSVKFLPLDTTAEPALTNTSIQKEIEASAKTLGLTFKYMPSGAGHDAQDISRFAPVGMIFVPSKGGISHSPKEFTSAEDMANGANVLLHSILSLDKKLD